MDWDRAKNLTIIFLCMLNIFLGVMYYTQHNQYVLTPEQEKAIYTILSQNKISMYTKIPKDYKPMKPLQMAGYHYDSSHLTQVFFGGETGITRRDEPNKTVFSKDAATLVIQNGYISYEARAAADAGRASAATRSNTAGYVDSAGDAVSLCEGFIQKLYDSHFVLEAQWQEDNEYALLYRNQYNGTIIYSNFISFRVSAGGIVQVETMFNRPLGYKGRALGVCSADEALFTLTLQAKRTAGDREVFINEMEFVYYLDPAESPDSDTRETEAEAAAQEAIPCYRISVWQQDISQDVDYLINAYTNTVIM